MDLRSKTSITTLYAIAAGLAAVFFYCPFSSALSVFIIPLVLLLGLVLSLSKPRTLKKFHFLGGTALFSMFALFVFPALLPMSGIDKRVDAVTVQDAPFSEFVSTLEKTAGYRCAVVPHEAANIGWERELRSVPPTISFTAPSGRVSDLLEHLNSSLGLIAVPQAVGGITESLSGHYSMRAITLHVLAPPGS